MLASITRPPPITTPFASAGRPAASKQPGDRSEVDPLGETDQRKKRQDEQSAFASVDRGTEDSNPDERHRMQEDTEKDAARDAAAFTGRRL